MGFRSTLISQHYGIDWPQWFRDKYPQLTGGPALSLNSETKTWAFFDLPADVQRALGELGWLEHGIPFVYVWLHECGGLTRVLVDRDAIHITYPTGWARYPHQGQDSVHGDGCNYCNTVPDA